MRFIIVVITALILAIITLPGCVEESSMSTDTKNADIIKIVWEGEEKPVGLTIGIEKSFWKIKESFGEDYYVEIEQRKLMGFDKRESFTEKDLLSVYWFEIEFQDGDPWKHNPEKYDPKNCVTSYDGENNKFIITFSR